MTNSDSSALSCEIFKAGLPNTQLKSFQTLQCSDPYFLVLQWFKGFEMDLSNHSQLSIILNILENLVSALKPGYLTT